MAPSLYLHVSPPSALPLSLSLLPPSLPLSPSISLPPSFPPFLQVCSCEEVVLCGEASPLSGTGLVLGPGPCHGPVSIPGHQCQDHRSPAEAEECDSEDSTADQLQAGGRAVGSGDTPGEGEGLVRERGEGLVRERGW